MEKYHTGRPLIRMREYGRYMQDLVRHANQVKDPELRQAYIEKVIGLIMEMYPQTKGIDDYRLKIWSHILQISDYELDVKVPDNVPREKVRKHPDKVPYPSRRVPFRHYGRNINTLIEKAVGMEDVEKQAEFVKVIAAYMKMAHQNYSQSEISDEIIGQDLERLSGGKLLVSGDSDMNYLTNNNTRRSRQQRLSNGPDKKMKTTGRSSRNTGNAMPATNRSPRRSERGSNGNNSNNSNNSNGNYNNSRARRK